MKPENIFARLPADESREAFAALLEEGPFRLERIVSFGQATAPGEWFDQPRNEWVMLLKGGAGIRFEGEPEVLRLRPGDHLLIPARCRHRVEWTERGEPTVWLALHYDAT
jgi:cupin 2 domain-containing protein